MAVGSGFDGPSHFLASGVPTGATLLKRRHLQLLGHALVSVPYWEWSECMGGRREGAVSEEQAGRVRVLGRARPCGQTPCPLSPHKRDEKETCNIRPRQGQNIHSQRLHVPAFEARGVPPPPFPVFHGCVARSRSVCVCGCVRETRSVANNSENALNK